MTYLRLFIMHCVLIIPNFVQSKFSSFYFWMLKLLLSTGTFKKKIKKEFVRFVKSEEETQAGLDPLSVILQFA